MPSTIAAVEEALHALLTSSTNAQVIYGPRGAFLQGDVISIDDIEFQHAPASLGDVQDVEEAYDVLLTISCSRTNVADQRIATEGALSLFTEIEALLEPVTQTLGVPGVLSVMVRGSGRITKHAEPEVLAKGRATSITCRVNVRAYI